MLWGDTGRSEDPHIPAETLCTHADQGLLPTVWQQDVCPWSLSSGQPAIPETGSFPPVVLPCRAGWLPTAALSTCQMAEAHLTYCEWISCHYTGERRTGALGEQPTTTSAIPQYKIKRLGKKENLPILGLHPLHTTVCPPPKMHLADK